MTAPDDMSGRVVVRHKLVLPVQIDRDTLDALPSPYHIAMYVTLLRLAQAEHNTAPGFKALAQQARMSVGKASSILNDLETAGIIARTRARHTNGMDSRTNYEILGVHGVKTPVHEVNEVRAVNGVRDVNTGSLQVGSPGEHRVLVPWNEKQQQAMAGLVRQGVTRVVAQDLVVTDCDEVERQLDLLPERHNVRDGAATLVKAIREKWSAPTSTPPTIPGLELPPAACDDCGGAPGVTTYQDRLVCDSCASSTRAAAEYDGPCLTCHGTGLVEIGGRQRRCPVGCAEIALV